MQTPAENFLAYAATRARQCQASIGQCVAQLTEDQLWHRGGDHENSVANLLLHLEGNIRQWILHGIDGQPDIRRRDDEFALDATTASAEALSAFNATVDEAAQVIAALPVDRLAEVIDPQPTGIWRHATILEAIFKVVSHLDHHTGQIILLTKQHVRRELDLSIPRKRQASG
jgi:uncharacterized damage-inducible protein DinB